MHPFDFNADQRTVGIVPKATYETKRGMHVMSTIAAELCQHFSAFRVQSVVTAETHRGHYLIVAQIYIQHIRNIPNKGWNCSCQLLGKMIILSDSGMSEVVLPRASG